MWIQRVVYVKPNVAIGEVGKHLEDNAPSLH